MIAKKKGKTTDIQMDIHEECAHQRKHDKGHRSRAVGLGHRRHIGDGDRSCPQRKASKPGTQHRRLVVFAHQLKQNKDDKAERHQGLKHQDYE